MLLLFNRLPIISPKGVYEPELVGAEIRANLMIGPPF